MEESQPTFHYPSDIELKNSPLAEAWLEIRWHLERDEKTKLEIDSDYPFALGVFFDNVRDEFGYLEKLEASRTPAGVFPYVVQHRFRPEKDGWPILQLGPGVASVNFTSPYSWDDFSEKALYLRNRLLESYRRVLPVKNIVLRYRNVEPFEYSSDNTLEFLREKLNTSIVLPRCVPGSMSPTGAPKTVNCALSFDLSVPVGIGTVQLASGVRQQDDEETGQQMTSEVLMWQLEVASKGDDVPGFGNEDEFVKWLTGAHSVIHEWFFSFVDGVLWEKYREEGE